MTSQQLAILNSLITYAAENVPGGLSPEEQEVARIVGTASLLGSLEGPQTASEAPTQVIRPMTAEEARELRALSAFREAFGGSLDGNEYGAVFRRCRELAGLPRVKSRDTQGTELERR